MGTYTYTFLHSRTRAHERFRRKNCTVLYSKYLAGAHAEAVGSRGIILQQCQHGPNTLICGTIGSARLSLNFQIHGVAPIKPGGDTRVPTGTVVRRGASIFRTFFRLRTQSLCASRIAPNVSERAVCVPRPTNRFLSLFFLLLDDDCTAHVRQVLPCPPQPVGAQSGWAYHAAGCLMAHERIVGAWPFDRFDVWVVGGWKCTGSDMNYLGEC